MRASKVLNLVGVLALISLLPLNAGGDGNPNWPKTFKMARYKILQFKLGVTNYYNAMRLQGNVGPNEKKMLIDGSIVGRQAVNAVQGCPEEYGEAKETLEKMYENLRKMELMAENRQVAFNQLEEWKESNEEVEELMDELEEFLKLK